MPLGSHGFAAPRAIVLHALRTFMPTHVLELGRPTLAKSTAFLALGFGAVNGQDFRTRRDPLGRFTLSTAFLAAWSLEAGNGQDFQGTRQ